MDTSEMRARIDNIPFPNGWLPSSGSMMFEYPSRYPNSHPVAYLPERYTYKGEPWKKNDLYIAGSDIENWEKVCLLRLSDQWDTSYSTITLIDTIQKAMKKPDDPNWFAKI